MNDLAMQSYREVMRSERGEYLFYEAYRLNVTHKDVSDFIAMLMMGCYL